MSEERVRVDLVERMVGVLGAAAVHVGAEIAPEYCLDEMLKASPVKAGVACRCCLCAEHVSMSTSNVV